MWKNTILVANDTRDCSIVLADCQQNIYNVLKFMNRRVKRFGERGGGGGGRTGL